MGIRANGETLNTVEAGTRIQLANTHYNLIPRPTLPSGLTNIFKAVSFTFPTAISIRNLGFISNALVGR